MLALFLPASCWLACSVFVLHVLPRFDSLSCPSLLWLIRFLGHLYAAEALISLDRISDAIAHLNPENVSDVSMGVLTSEQDQGLWLLDITEQNTQFIMAMWLNVGVCFCQQGLTKETSLSSPVSPPTLNLSA